MKPTVRLFTFVLFALSIHLPLAQAGSLTVIATPGSSQDAQLLFELETLPGVLGSELVFSLPERQSLDRMGGSTLSQSRKLKLRSQTVRETLQRWIKQKNARIDLSRDSIPVSIEEDPLEKEQWGLHNDGHAQTTALDDITSLPLTGKPGEDIGIDRAPPETTTESDSKPVVVAVLDTGIDVAHPDLKDRIVRKDAECKALTEYKDCLKQGPRKACDDKYAHTDTDHNGYPMDCTGWNLTVGKSPVTGIIGNPTVQDDVGHGTHVAGIIASASGNRLGIRGIVRNARILPVKVLSAAPRSPVRPQDTDPEIPTPVETDKKWQTGFTDMIARGILYAIRSQAQIINLSLAWPGMVDSPLIRQMAELAAKQGVLLISAAGNDSTDAEVMPCSYPSVLCVAAHLPDGSLAAFSNFGPHVEVAAPGINILSAWPLALRPVRFTDLKGYELKNGTSMASPFVAGIAARLLAEGSPPEEVRARILLGARPLQVQPQDKQIMFGNADLAGALKALPQPLILPSTKVLTELSWNGQPVSLPLNIDFQSFWRPASQVKIDLSLALPPGVARVEKTTLSKSDAQLNEPLTLTSQFVIVDPGSLPSEVTLHAQISCGECQPRTVPLRLRIHRLITGTPGNLTLEGGALSPGSTLYSVRAGGGIAQSALPSFWAIRTFSIPEGPQWEVKLLRTPHLPSDPRKVTPQATRTLPAPEGDLLSIHEILTPQGPQFVTISTFKPSADKPQVAFRFMWFDSTLKNLRSQDYGTATAMLPEDFLWLKTQEGFIPAWVGGGFTPELEKPAYDPWDPDPKDPPAVHLYTISPDGLRTISPPDSEMEIVSTLAMTEADRILGQLPVLLAKGNSYFAEYQVGVARIDAKTGKPVITDLKPLVLPQYRMFQSADSVLPILPLNSQDNALGTAWITPSIRGSTRATLVFHNGKTGKTLDQLLSPTQKADSVLRVAGVFADEERTTVVSQTLYNLQFHDLQTGKTASTSLRRFSFLPQLTFYRSFIPVLATQGHKRVPGMLITGDLNGTEIVEAALPGFAPALLRFKPGNDCQRVGNPAAPFGGDATKLIFFCGSEVHALPLSLP